jgi:peroxiredoxin
MKTSRFAPVALFLLLVAPTLAMAEHPKADHPQGEHPKGEHPKGEHPAPAATAPAAVGDKAPAFKLTDTDGVEHTLAQYLADGKIVVLEWFNPDCPFIIKHHKTNQTMDETYATLKHKGVVWLAVNSGAAGKQGAGLERNKKAREEYRMTFPVLLDETGSVGRAYGAKTTPHMFIIGKDGKLAYSGAIDDNASPTEYGTRNYIISALRGVLDGRAVPEPVTKPYGCSVKYAD